MELSNTDHQVILAIRSALGVDSIVFRSIDARVPDRLIEVFHCDARSRNTTVRFITERAGNAPWYPSPQIHHSSEDGEKDCVVHVVRPSHDWPLSLAIVMPASGKTEHAPASEYPTDGIWGGS